MQGYWKAEWGCLLIQGEQSSFCPGDGSLAQLYPLTRWRWREHGQPPCPTSPHVPCGTDEGLQPCLAGNPLASALGGQSRQPIATVHPISVFLKSKSGSLHAGSESDLLPFVVGLNQSCPLSLVRRIGMASMIHLSSWWCGCSTSGKERNVCLCFSPLCNDQKDMITSTSGWNEPGLRDRVKILQASGGCHISTWEAFTDEDSRESHIHTHLTFISTDSLSFSLLTIFIATFWHVTQWIPNFTRPETYKHDIKLIRVWEIAYPIFKCGLSYNVSKIYAPYKI